MRKCLSCLGFALVRLRGLLQPSGVLRLCDVFYGRNNLLINGDIGWVVDNVFATIVEGLDEMAASVGRDPSQNRTHRPPVQG